MTAALSRRVQNICRGISERSVTNNSKTRQIAGVALVFEPFSLGLQSILTKYVLCFVFCSFVPVFCRFIRIA